MPDSPAADLDAADRAVLDGAMLVEQVRMLTDRRIDLPISLAGATIVAGTLWRLYPVWVAALWLGLFYVVIVVRYVTRRHYLSLVPGADAARRWVMVFTLNSFVTACLWGAIGSAVLLSPNPVYRNFAFLVLAGMTAGGIVSNAAYMPAVYAFAVPAILPVIIALLTLGDITHVELAIMMAIYAVFVTGTGRGINRSIRENFRLRVEQDVLLSKLRASDQAMQDAQAIAHTGSWLFDVQTHAITWSAETFRIFGFDPLGPQPSYEDMIARVHPLDRATIGDNTAQIMASGKGREFDYRLLMDDGAVRYVHATTRAILHTSRQVSEVLGTVSDTTRQRLAENRLQFANMLLETQSAASPDGILVVDPKRRIISLNRRFGEIWKLPPDSLRAGDDGSALAAGKLAVKDPAAFLARVEYLYAHPDESVHDEFEMADGRVIDRYTTILVSPADELLGRIWYFRDITERRQSADRLQFANLLLKSQSEASLDGILVVDPNRRIISFNNRFSEIVSVPVGTLQAGSDMSILKPEDLAVTDPAGFVARVEYLYAHPDESAHDEFEMADGRIITRYSTNLLSPAKVPLGRVWYFRDITERRRAALELADRERLLQSVIAGTAVLVKAESLAQAMPEALRVVGESLRVDRVLMLEDHGDMQPPGLRASWNQQGDVTPPDMMAFTTDPADFIAVSAWRAGMRDGSPLIAQHATSEKAIRKLLEFYHNESSLLVPIFIGPVLWGNLAADSCSIARDWTKNEIDTLKTFGGIAGALLVRHETQQLLEASEQRFRVLSGTAQDAIITVDATARISTWNRAAERILGYTAEEAVGQQIHHFLLPTRFQDKAGIAMRRFAATGEGDALNKTTELTALRKDGTEIAVEVSLAGAKVAGQWEAVGILRDVTARKEAAARLQFANIVLTTQMEASLDGILVVNASQSITAFNHRFAQMWQIPLDVTIGGRDDLALSRVTALITDPKAFTERVADLYSHTGITADDDIATIDGRAIERHTVPLTGPTGQYLGRAWFFRDVTERNRAAAMALRMARFDVLTGLANRAVFVDALDHAIAAVKRGAKGFAVIYLDLDHFKDVNDTLGHPVGDLLLAAVADLLRANTRSTDTVARFGGDEFAIVVSDIGQPADAAILADKLITAFNVPIRLQGNEIHIGASIGIATYDTDSPNAENLLSHADVALYRAKSDGRGSYRFFTDAMDREVKMRVRLGMELRDAIAAGQLFLMYQPQVEVDTGRIIGMESLVRWRHPSRGVIGPDIFIPIAEQIGVISQLGHWVLWQACRQAKLWRDAGIPPVRISLNVSALQFRSPIALEDDIAAALAETGMPPQLLELELTERVLMDASRAYGDVLQRLRQTGVTIAIDDFGTGYSSLDYLHRFPSNRIKIAQSFVKNLETAPGDAAIVRATIGLARELGIDVIAEGVETAGQAILLKRWGCDEVQGFHFARPLAVAEATTALRAGEVRKDLVSLTYDHELQADGIAKVAVSPDQGAAG